MYIKDLQERKTDRQGSGWYGASRGSRKHNGTDRCCAPGTEIQLGLPGRVVKVGWAYSHSERSHIRYIAIRLSENWYCRIFYINPKVKLGEHVNNDTIIGESQSLGEFFPGITEHVHFEVYKLKNPTKSIHSKKNFLYTDPTLLLEVT